ncbi:MAG: class I SAM-dependent methyltransferase [bacterium]|nr:class I SAM-dependent methyltransferase [bacterium]
MDSEKVKKILKETELGYDFVAQKFSQNRNRFWGRVDCIRELVKDGNRVLDFGCGDGSLLDLFSGKNIEYFGVDVSETLIDQAKKRYFGENIHPIKYPLTRGSEQFNRVNFSKIDSGQSILPFEDNYFNVVYSIAVFHHLPSKKYREKMSRELYRVTKPGGYIIVTVWNLWQKKYIKNIFRNWISKLLGKNSLDWNDCLIDFKNDEGKIIFKRYHHAFTQGELNKLFSEIGLTQKECQLPKNWNLVFAGRKV